ncbi:MAG: ABC transporter ATP-binding protein [Cyanobacteria bacterium P01_G01_bin.54]
MLLAAFSEVMSLGAVLPFLSVLNNAENLLKNAHLQPFILAFKITSAAELVTWITIAFVLITIATNSLRILTLYTQTHLSARIASDLSRSVYQRILLQPYSFYSRHNSSDLITVLVSDSSIAGNVLGSFLFMVANSFVIVALILGLFAINATVALTTTVVLSTVYLLLFSWRRQKLASNSQLITQHNQLLLRAIQESLGGIREVILSGHQNFFQSTFAHSDYAIRQAYASNQITYSSPRYGIEVVAIISIALLALTLGRDGDFSQAVPVLGSLALGANRLLPALQQSFAALATMQGSRYSLQRVLTTLQQSFDPLQAWVAPQALVLQRELRFEQVWFRYSLDDDWVLRDLNLIVRAKSTVGFVGTTGSGKSTTADLILGLLQPEKGQIFADDFPLVGERLRAWQASIAHVPQTIFLSDATIAENIAFGLPQNLIDPQRVAKAARLAQLSEFIETLPEGYKTVVGERGIRLSGGQRQRVGIARALYRDVQVLVFDEATSALDNATEKEVMAAIDGLSKELTIILIAHRLTTIEKCEIIFEFAWGQVVGSGTYKDLIKTSSSFRKMALSSSQ